MKHRVLGFLGYESTPDNGTLWMASAPFVFNVWTYKR